MEIIQNKIQGQILIKIKRIVDEDKNGDKFIINRSKKNTDFIREYNLKINDIKNIIRSLSIEDCFAGPEEDHNPKYEGWIFKFCPIYREIKLYIKIRVETNKKAICISIHQYGLYDEEEA